ncbi:hypothetical protein MCHI_004064, partial [Candidatus Magnetoovum chiemensis]
HPTKKYSLLAFKNIFTNKAACIAVIRKEEQTVNILELLSVNNEIAGRFLRALEIDAYTSGSRQILIWLNRHDHIANTFTASAYQIKEDIPLAVRIIDQNKLTETSFFKGYIYRMGDYDDN